MSDWAKGNGKARGWGEGCVKRTGQGERSCPKPIPGGVFLWYVLSGTRWSSSLLSRVQLNQQAHSPLHSITGVKIRGELLSHFSVGMTKPTNSWVMYITKWALMSPSYNMIVLFKLELAPSSKTNFLWGMALASPWLPCSRTAPGTRLRTRPGVNARLLQSTRPGLWSRQSDSVNANFTGYQPISLY